MMPKHHDRESSPRVRRVWLVLIVAGLVILLVCWPRPPAAVPGAHLNKGTNAAWLGVEWVSESHSPQEIDELADGLRGRQIRHVFAYASYLKPDGRFNPTHSHSSDFVQTLEARQPGISVQAWIGLPLAYVDLADAAVRQRIVEFCAGLVQEEGFDGIHLDPEPVADGDTHVLSLLDEVRQGIGTNATLSIATRRISPIPVDVALPIIGRFVWQAGYYHEVAQRVDQIAAMTYDSGLPLSPLYRAWVGRQVVLLGRAVDGTRAELFIGVPASEERTFTHWPEAENVTSGLQGVIDGLTDPSVRPSVVTGVAIYPYWEMDAKEWASYESLWIQ